MDEKQLLRKYIDHILMESNLWKSLEPKIEDGDYDKKCVEYWKDQILKGNHRPILVNQNNEILDGNHTLTAYQELDIKPKFIYRGERSDFYPAAVKTNGDAMKAIDVMIKDGTATLEEAVEVHDTLNPKLWDGMQLKDDVKETLLDVANHFVDNLSFPINVADIRFLGSNASYNYNDKSDIDLHIITNFDINYVDDAILQQLYNGEKNSFNNRHDITVKGIEVELYIEDMKSMNATNGSYSLLQNKWIKEPKPIDYVIPDYSRELEDEINIINNVLTSTESETVKDEINKIYLMRKDGLANEGEASIGNLVFKELRNLGKIQELTDKYYELESNELSLESEKLTESEDTVTIYRAVIADNEDQARKYIKSTQRYAGRDFGPGMYWTKDSEVVHEYGNYIFKAEIPVNQVKKFVDEQDIVILTAEAHKNLNPELIDFIDVGLNAKYAFHPKLWGEKRHQKINESVSYRIVDFNELLKIDENLLDELESRSENPEYRILYKRLLRSKTKKLRMNYSQLDYVAYIYEDDPRHDEITNILYGNINEDEASEKYSIFLQIKQINPNANYDNYRKMPKNQMLAILYDYINKVRDGKTFKKKEEPKEVEIKPEKYCVGIIPYSNNNFKIIFNDNTSSILSYEQAKRQGYLDKQDLNDKDREEYELDHLDESKQLTEATLTDIMNDSKATDPRRIELSKSLYTEYKGVDSDGTLLFETDSQTRSNLGHKQYIFYESFFNLLDKADQQEAITEEDVVDILTGDVMLKCTCESFLYFAWAYKSWKDGYGLQKELRAPQRNNVNLNGGTCKHCLSVLELINRSNTLFDKIAKDLNELFQHYRKRTITQQEIERLQNELKGMKAPDLKAQDNNDVTTEHTN